MGWHESSARSREIGVELRRRREQAGLTGSEVDAATAMAAVRDDQGEVAELRGLLDKLGEEPSVEELVANDLEFHRRIALGSGNQVLCSLVEGLSGPTRRARILAANAVPTRHCWRCGHGLSE